MNVLDTISRFIAKQATYSIFLTCLATLPLAAQTSGAQRSGSAAATQTNTGQGTTANSEASVRSTVKKRVHRRKMSTVTIPRETASATQSGATQSGAASPATEAQQRSADAKLLQQQQAQSDKAARITDEQVRRAQARRDAQQNEIRIQDAPGPAQTGVVPAAGVPVAPASTDQRIQDQPSAVPSQNSPAPQN